MFYGPGQSEDDEAVRAAGARLFLLCCLCVGGGGCPYTELCGAVRSCRCSAPRLSWVMSAALGEPSSICCRLIITSSSGSWKGLFQATEQSFPAVDEAVPSLAAGKSQWLWEVCGLSCIQHVAGAAGRVCHLAGILLSWRGALLRAHLRQRGGSAAPPELSWSLRWGGRQRGAPAPPQLHNSSAAA